MAANPEEFWKMLKLTDEEEHGVTIDGCLVDQIQTMGSCCLVGRLWTKKQFKVEAMKHMMELMWSPAKGLEIKDIGENLFQFQFNDQEDRNRVLVNGPWIFNKSILLLKRAEIWENPTDISLTDVSFWIRVYGLPLLCMNEEVGKVIGNAIGHFEKISLPKGGISWGRFMRIRVSIDVRKPLKRGMNFSVGNVKKTWIVFKYERLPNFCYYCGCLGHIDTDCELASQLKADGNKLCYQYGPWIRAYWDQQYSSNRIQGKVMDGVLAQSSNDKAASPQKGKDEETDIGSVVAMESALVDSSKRSGKGHADMKMIKVE